MINLISKIAPKNKKDIYLYMLMLVAFLPIIYILLGGQINYMIMNVFCLIIFSIVFIFQLIKIIRTKNSKNYTKSTAFIILTLLFAWMFFSNFFAYDKTASWFGFIDGTHQEVSVWQYIFYYIVALCAMNLKKENLNYLLSFIITIACFIIVFQFIFNNFGLGFIHKNHTGYYLCITLMLAVGKFFFSKSRLETILSIIAIILHFISLILNGSMGPVIGIVAFFAIGLVYILIYKREIIFRFLSLFLCFLSIICIFDYVPKLKDFRDEQVTTFEKLVDIGIVALNKIGIIDDEKIAYEEIAPGSDGYDRLMMWERAIDNMKEFPLFGTGMGWKSYNKDMPSMKPHNEFLQYGSMCGVPALIFYLALILYLFIKFRKIHKKQSNMSFVFISVLFVYLVQSIFGNVMPFVAPIFYLVIGLLIKEIDFEKVEADYNLKENKKP